MLENLLGFCEEQTTYRDGYRFPVVLQRDEKNRERKEAVKAPKKVQLYSESYDTLQKLDYYNRLPFNALWDENDDTNAKIISERTLETQERVIAPRTRPDESVNPGVNLDDADPKLRNIVLNYMYKTTASQGAEEIWRDWKKREIQPRSKNYVHQIDPVSLKVKLIPDLPAGFKGAAKKWDFLQERSFNDERQPSATKKTPKKPDILDPSLLALKNKKLRLPYEKMPPTYSGYRTPLAIGVDLIQKERSIYDPYISVSQVLNMRRSQDG